MGELKGYLGAFYCDSTTISNGGEELVGTGDGTTTVFDMGAALGNIEMVRPDTLKVRRVSVTSDFSDVWLRDYNLDPTGVIRFHTPPDSDDDIFAALDGVNSLTQRGGFFNWSIDATADALETTAFNTTGWRTYLPGLKGWTATAQRHWQTGAEDSDLFEATKSDFYYVKFYLDTDGGRGYSGWGRVTGLSTTAPVDALVDDSITMTGFDRLAFFSDAA